MKIYRTNQSQFNPYERSLNEQQRVKKQYKFKDELEISNEAKSLLENKVDSSISRNEKVSELKLKVENGEYDLNLKETARKMIKFWTKDY